MRGDWPLLLLPARPPFKLRGEDSADDDNGCGGDMTVCVRMTGDAAAVAVVPADGVISNFSGSLFGVQGRLNERTRDVLDSASAAGMRGGGSRGPRSSGLSTVASVVNAAEDVGPTGAVPVLVTFAILAMVGEGSGQFESRSFGAVATRFRGEKAGKGSAGVNGEAGENGDVFGLGFGGGGEDIDGALRVAGALGAGTGAGVLIVAGVFSTSPSSWCCCCCDCSWSCCWSFCSGDGLPSTGNFSMTGDVAADAGKDEKSGKRKLRMRSSGSSSP